MNDSRRSESQKVVHKVKFSQIEDAQLVELVTTYGQDDWSSIARQMGNRNVRQCRERWCNYLAPSVVNGPWTPEEDARLVRQFKELGPKWKAIAGFFPGRTDVNIKNHWMTLVRRPDGPLGINRMDAPSVAQPEACSSELTPHPPEIPPPIDDIAFEVPRMPWDLWSDAAPGWISGFDQRQFDPDLSLHFGFL
jgi:hypothetical protein